MPTSKHIKLKVVCDATCRMPSSNHYGKGKAACAVILVDYQGNIVEERGRYLGEMTPPQAEYHGLIFGLDIAVEYCRKEVEVWMDCELVIKQMNGDYCIRSQNVKPLFDEVKKLENRFCSTVKYFHHDRGSFWARRADKVANSEYSRHQTG